MSSPWLSDEQQQVWRQWLALSAALPAALQRQLQHSSSLSLADFDVLVALSEAVESKLRIGDLASSLTWERSRLSHHLTRMEKRDLVQREECFDDGRGAFVTLTAAGRSAIESAAPAHVETVRRLLFEDLSARELQVLDTFTTRALARLSAPPDRSAR